MTTIYRILRIKRIEIEAEVNKCGFCKDLTNAYTKRAGKHNLVELHIINKETNKEYRS